MPDEQTIVSLEYEQGLTAEIALARSGLRERFPEIGSEDLVLGVWGKKVSAVHVLQPGDRVEVSRPLQADPRDMRREFMTDGKVMGGASAPASGVRKKGRE